jgi:DNA-binding response OmpR family regulator
MVQACAGNSSRKTFDAKALIARVNELLRKRQVAEQARALLLHCASPASAVWPNSQTQNYREIYVILAKAVILLVC